MLPANMIKINSVIVQRFVQNCNKNYITKGNKFKDKCG
jgi:hypothetical protein